MDYAFGLLKPDCLKRGLMEIILSMIEESGLKILETKQVRLNAAEVGIIWPACVNEPYYPEMLEFSTSGDCLVFIVYGHDAINRLDKLVGHYDPNRAEAGTIRKLFATSPMENIIHSVDDEDAFGKQASLFFNVKSFK